MPLHDVGYRGWTATPYPRGTAWWVIASTGCHLIWKSLWIRRLLYFAWIPAAYLGLGIFAFEKAVQYPEWQTMLRIFLRRIPGSQFLPPSLFEQSPIGGALMDLSPIRYRVWAFILLTLLRYPQGFLMVLLVGLIAPGLISADLRSRAYLLYFSRPVKLWEYILGKSLTVWAYLLVISALPALSLYAIGVLLSADLRVITYTWDLPLRILLASAALLIPTTGLALGLSSLSTENRGGLYGWFAVWVIGWTVYSNVKVTHSVTQTPAAESTWWSCASLYHVLGHVQAWIFGLESNRPLVMVSAVILICVTVIGYLVLWRRIAAPLRV